MPSRMDHRRRDVATPRPSGTPNVVDPKANDKTFPAELQQRLTESMRQAHLENMNVLHSEDHRSFTPLMARNGPRTARQDTIDQWNKEQLAKYSRPTGQI